MTLNEQITDVESCLPVEVLPRSDAPSCEGEVTLYPVDNNGRGRVDTLEGCGKYFEARFSQFVPSYSF